eukprot:TRINITY_DN4637_c0_g1_i1.p1 TRINITY_DN4637_c0_g1~~TRINITY_DN4637_c0_g1_i1.p1  ORF type:complete len:270 (-),score=38.32 TRINITY_DN4637_c0_g1_i1:3-812(-)
MILGCFQGKGFGADRDNNHRLIEQVSRQAAKQGVNLVVFPELITCGYGNGEEMLRLSEDPDGPTFEKISHLCKELSIAMAVCYPEKSTGANKCYNSVMIVDKSGKRLSNYRKTHLYVKNAFENDYLIPGENLPPIVEIEGMKVASIICFDVEFPEVVRDLALKGAQVVVVPTANTTEWINTMMVPTRAYENHLFIGYVNRSGLENGLHWCGKSSIVAPNGHFLAIAGNHTDELLIARIDPSEPQYKDHVEHNPYFSVRNPQLYSPLCQK